MKITVEQEKPVYKPITITLETAQEYFELLAAIVNVSDDDLIGGFRKLKLCGLYYGGSDKIHESLRAMMLTMKEQVKETL